MSEFFKSQLNSTCSHAFISRQQRINERLQGKDFSGTKAYEEQGCYSCKGNNFSCSKYYHSQKINEFFLKDPIKTPFTKIKKYSNL